MGIDLVYTPIKSRGETLSKISEELSGIGNVIAERLPKVKVQYLRMARTDFIIKLLARAVWSVVKIELSPVLRGTVYPPEVRRICSAAENRFAFVEMSVISFEDQFGGKMVAAPDPGDPQSNVA